MIPKNKCLSCSRLLWDDTPPFETKEGMHTVCAFCGFIMQLDKNLNLISANNVGKSTIDLSNAVKELNKIQYGCVNDFVAREAKRRMKSN